jgi:hypothetical protein
MGRQDQVLEGHTQSTFGERALVTSEALRAAHGGLVHSKLETGISLEAAFVTRRRFADSFAGNLMDIGW